MDNRMFVKVYLEDDMADKICQLGGGDSISAGIQTALNLAVAQLLHSPILDQQRGRSIRA